jgi:hypothetical protein
VISESALFIRTIAPSETPSRPKPPGFARRWGWISNRLRVCCRPYFAAWSKLAFLYQHADHMPDMHQYRHINPSLADDFRTSHAYQRLRCKLRALLASFQALRLPLPARWLLALHLIFWNLSRWGRYWNQDRYSPAGEPIPAKPSGAFNSRKSSLRLSWGDPRTVKVTARPEFAGHCCDSAATCKRIRSLVPRHLPVAPRTEQSSRLEVRHGPKKSTGKAHCLPYQHQKRNRKQLR